jgi:hypothetical protein
MFMGGGATCVTGGKTDIEVLFGLTGVTDEASAAVVTGAEAEGVAGAMVAVSSSAGLQAINPDMITIKKMIIFFISIF